MKKTFKALCLHTVLGLVALSASCRTSMNSSSTKDIGTINTTNAQMMVIYEDQGQVYVKTCVGSMQTTLTRACAGNVSPKKISINDYIQKLPFDVGPYQRTPQGLELVKSLLTEARKAAANGNTNANSTVANLDGIRLNLETILKLRSDLTAQQQSLTYYEYNDEFPKLLAPFGVSASIPGNNGKPAPAGGVNTGSMTPKQCFSILRVEMSANWFDNNLWPACLGGGDLSCVVQQFREHRDYYPEDLPGPCGGTYDLNNQPDFDVSDLPTKPEIRPIPTTPTSPPTNPSRPSTGGGGNGPACRNAKDFCQVNWECCSNSCGLDGLCQAGSGGCVARGGHCQAGWECCSKDCNTMTGLCR